MSWKDNVRKVTPYTPGEQPKEERVIKLNTNENPYPPSPKVLEGMNGDMLLRKYPDPSASELVNALAAYHGVDKKQVFVGVGSDDVLGMAFLTFFNSDKPVLFPDITYSFYPVWAELFRIPTRIIPLDDSFSIRKEDYEGDQGGIIFPNPNAPTGKLLPLYEVESVISSHPECVVIIDEAYIDFAPEGSSALKLIDKYPNLLVVRTFSKSRSMAGLRIGYAIGQSELIEALQSVKYSYNSYTMNMPSINWGVRSIEDDGYFRETRDKIVETRRYFTEELEKLHFKVIPSEANFVFASHESVSAKEIFEKAREKGIFFRYFNQPRIDDFLRITIGTREDMDEVLSFFRKISL